VSALTQSPAWSALAAHARELAPRHLRQLFADDPRRARDFTLEFDEIYLDYSKQRVTVQTMSLLQALARQADVRGWTQRMFAGERINNSQDRAALHVALRSDMGEFPAGASVMDEVRACKARVRAFVDQARSGKMPGAAGQAITDVVNMGIGGSDLGPRLVTQALGKRGTGLRVHFAANIDPAELDALLARLDRRSTLFIVASKTFTTVETLNNARRAKTWLGGESSSAAQFAAVTANSAAARAFGIESERIFPIWDWVGGRYSIWSAVGLSAALALGNDQYEEFQEGARQMDAHFHTAPLESNLPAILALLSVWNINFRGAACHAILPYSHSLRSFPAYLQQLEMESNGKRVDRQGNEIDYATAPVIWGAAGTPSQHSFHQLLHQGTPDVPVDFIVPLQAAGDAASQALLVSNALAQGAALLAGTAPGVAAHAASPGNRPSNTLLIERLTPEALGQLIALYEHKVFVQGIIWNINSFDQWGVELGKNIARSLEENQMPGNIDASTAALLARARRR
jgi:glucose-6-phosphate isomerase